MNTLVRFVSKAALPLAAILPVAMAGAETVAPTAPQASFSESVKVNIQLTEVGCMRTLLVLDQSTLPSEKQIEHYLTAVDFRLFPSAQTVGERFTSREAIEMGKAVNADLVLYATASIREKKKLDDFSLYEGEATVQMWNVVSGELLASTTERATGTRTSDEVEAKRGAVEKAVDAAANGAVTMSLGKAQKLLVHEAVITGVFSDGALLAIMEYMGKMDGVYHVRRLSFDKQAHEALIEIIGSPRSETYWRAYLEKMPRTTIYLNVETNKSLRSKYPSWFLPKQ